MNTPASPNEAQPPPRRLAGWRLRQVVADTYQLSKVGGFLYVFGWAVIGWIGGVHAFAPVTALVVALGFLVLAVLRVAMRPPTAGGDAADRRWLLRFALVLPLASVLWAGVQAWVLLDPRFDQDTRMVSLIATIGYATVFANIYSTVRHLAAVGVCVLFVPMLVVLWSNGEARALAVAMSFYALYLAGALVRSHAEYRRRLRLDEALREQRDQFEHLSRTDSLTGLANRRHFTDRLAHAADRALRGGPGFTLLILDIDHFKRVNDRHGHAVGDACLQALAERLQRAFPAPGCLLARLGGEEFGVLLEHDHAQALALAEALRHALVQRPLDCGPGVQLPITVSMGIGGFEPSRHGDADGLYRAVDMALYLAKDQGRNRVQALEAAGA
ncbi:MAG TPA: GGDEF domain-containing protein [Arenimonas sp.]|uniref:GGDEF domain-containing protein n=1 Tax=Arenimonas sp. TaxID=1872635 RepID=UPI002D80C230|nr:GGDEF domain-containing protein [Arenimonas sp.]HEU0152252.1 GGDEF domain-containing protein [Arenimonas sp.]